MTTYTEPMPPIAHRLSVSNPPPCALCAHPIHLDRCSRWGCRCDALVPSPEAHTPTAAVTRCIAVSPNNARLEALTRNLSAAGFAVEATDCYEDAIAAYKHRPPGLFLVDAHGTRGGTSFPSFNQWLSVKQQEAHFAVLYLVVPGVRKVTGGWLGPRLKKPLCASQMVTMARGLCRPVIRADGEVSLNLNDLGVMYHGRRTTITPQESRILSVMALNLDDCVRSDELLRSACGYAVSHEASTLVRAHLSNLRRKLHEGGVPIEIETVRHRGYRLTTPITLIGSGI